MSEFTTGNTPGIQAEQESIEAQVTWAGRNGQTLAATKKIVLDSTSTDSGNTPSTTVRGGHVLAIDTATGRAFIYDPDATDGKQIAVGILEHSQDMLVAGVATNRFTQMLVHGFVKESEILNLDARAKQQLASRFVFDQSLTQIASELMHPRGTYRKSSNYTVTAADNGLLFLSTGAVNFTLPTKANGLAFRFLQTADANMVVTGSSDIVTTNNAAASTVTFSTANQKIGSQVLVECVYTTASTLKWIVSNLGGTTMTIA